LLLLVHLDLLDSFPLQLVNLKEPVGGTGFHRRGQRTALHLRHVLKVAILLVDGLDHLFLVPPAAFCVELLELPLLRVAVVEEPLAWHLAF